MVPQGRMTDKQRTMVAELSKQYKKTGRAFRIVKSLDDFYASTSMVEVQSDWTSCVHGCDAAD